MLNSPYKLGTILLSPPTFIDHCIFLQEHAMGGHAGDLNSGYYFLINAQEALW